MLSDVLRFATVVVIDDVRANLRLLESSLKAFGLREIKAFSDSAEGLAWLQANPWDLLLLDLICRRRMASRFCSNWPAATAAARR